MPWRKYTKKNGIHGPIYAIDRGVTVRCDSRGKWIVFIEKGGQRKNKTVGSGRSNLVKAIKVAEVLASKVESLPQEQQEKVVESKYPNLIEYSKDWLETNAGRWSPSTYERYEEILRLHVHSYNKFANLKVNEVSRKIIKDFLVYKRGQRAQRTVESFHAVLSGIFEDLIEDRILDFNPTRNLLKKILKKKRKRTLKKPNPFTISERDHFLDRAKMLCDDDWHLVLKVMFYAGFRLGEVLAMKYEFLDFDKNIYQVRETFRRRKFGLPKSGEIRFVDFPSFLMEELKDYCVRLKKKSLKSGKGGFIDILFQDPSEKKGYPYSQRKIQALVKKICRSAGLRERTPHQMRHTYATIMLMAHQSPAYVQKQLGHSSIQITVDIYGHWISGEGRDGLEKALKVPLKPVPNRGEKRILSHMAK